MKQMLRQRVSSRCIRVFVHQTGYGRRATRGQPWQGWRRGSSAAAPPRQPAPPRSLADVLCCCCRSIWPASHENPAMAEVEARELRRGSSGNRPHGGAISFLALPLPGQVRAFLIHHECFQECQNHMGWHPCCMGDSPTDVAWFTQPRDT